MDAPRGRPERGGSGRGRSDRTDRRGSSGRRVRQDGIARREAISAMTVAALAGLGVWLVMGRDPAPAGPATRLEEAPSVPAATMADERPPDPATIAEEPDEENVVLEVPESDADLQLVFGEADVPVRAGELPRDTPVSIDLVLPLSFPGHDTFPVRVFREGADALLLESTPTEPGGPQLRLELPAGWLAPGRHLISVRTPERTHFPSRRFLLVVE